MQFFSNVSDTIGLPPGTTFGSVVSSVLTPGTVNSGTTFSRIEAVSSVNFRVADLMYNRLIFGTPNAYMNWSAGVRYGHLHQNFEQNAEFAQPNNPQFTTSSVNFDGVGPRIGLDGRRRLGATCFSGYGQGSISTLFGDTVTGYSQTDTLTTALLASSNWQSFRVVPVLDFELGLSWTNCGGHLRVGGGYYTAFWFNAITTPQYISAVQHNNFISLGDTVTFTGAVLHARGAVLEIRWDAVPLKIGDRVIIYSGRATGYSLLRRGAAIPGRAPLIARPKPTNGCRQAAHKDHRGTHFSAGQAP